METYLLSDDALIRAQKSYKKDRDLSLLVTVGFVCFTNY